MSSATGLNRILPWLAFAAIACGSNEPHDASRPPASPALADAAAPLSTPTLTFVDADGKSVSSVALDARVAVRVSGLAPNARIVIEAEMAPWKSSATFRSMPDGTVDSARDAPEAGTYEGVDADGFFWSMNTDSFAYAKSSDVAFRVLLDGAVVASATLARPFDRPGVRTRTPKDVAFVGELLVPPGEGPFATFVAFGGSEGGISGGLDYADALVGQGYAVLALAYFGEKGVPSELVDVPLEYFDGAFEWLKKQPEVDATRLGVVGGSRGGELALLLASRRKELRAVVADVPSGYVWGGLMPSTAAWTVGGKPLAAIPDGDRAPDSVKTPRGDRADVFTPVFADAVAKASPAEREAARIPIENAGAAIALFGGADDQLWPSCDLAKVAWTTLVDTGHVQAKRDVFECFAGAGHILGAPGLPTTWSAFMPIEGGETLALGGTPAGTAHAARARQAKLKAFLDDVMPAKR